MTLADLRRKDKFRIERVTLKGEVGKRLVDMGLNRGIEGEVLRCALVGDPIEIRIRNYNISLRKSEAAGVEVVATEISREGRGKGHGHGKGLGHGHGKGCGHGKHHGRDNKCEHEASESSEGEK